MNKVERPTEEELQAYVDDRLGFERRVEIEAYLLAHPAAASVSSPFGSRAMNFKRLCV